MNDGDLNERTDQWCTTCAANARGLVRGHLYVIEGGDACGKNTQALELHRRLNAERVLELHRCLNAERASSDAANVVPTMFFSFPRYDTTIGMAILRHLKGETKLVESGGDTAPEDKLVFQCMMAADRYLAAPQIEAQLQRGGDVVCDRWSQSALVYGRLDGLDVELLTGLHDFLPRFDLAMLIDVPASQAAERRPIVRDRYEEKMTTRELVRGFYLGTWAHGHEERQRRWPVVDGTETVEEVSKRIWNLVRPHLGEST